MKHMWDLVCCVKLGSTQTVWQQSAPTAQLARQTVTSMRSHLVQTARQALQRLRVILDHVVCARPASTQMHQQLSVLTALPGRVTMTPSPLHRVPHALLDSMQSLESLARAMDVLLVATVLYRVVRAWMSVMHVYLDRIQTTALRRALSVLVAQQMSTVILQQIASNVLLGRTLAAARQNATYALQVRSTVTPTRQRPALHVLLDRRGRLLC